MHIIFVYNVKCAQTTLKLLNNNGTYTHTYTYAYTYTNFFKEYKDTM